MPDLDAALARLAQTEVLLVALDFDGTLAPLVDDPATSRALPRSREAVLRLLDAPRTRVALISGRAIDSLREVTQLPNTVLLSGSHGVEVMLDSEPELTLTDDEKQRTEALRLALEAVAAGREGVWVEVKPAGLALHTRLATDEVTEAATADAIARVSAIPGLTSRRGSNVLEFSVRAADKGDAVRQLKKYSSATGVFFAGDDITDEDAFAALSEGDVGVKCGSGSTVAEYSVSGPEEVAEVLHRLVELRGSANSG